MDQSAKFLYIIAFTVIIKSVCDVGSTWSVCVFLLQVKTWESACCGFPSKKTVVVKSVTELNTTMAVLGLTTYSIGTYNP